MNAQCPRCGYPDPGPRVPSFRTGLTVCVPCGQVEALEFRELGRVLPLRDWAVND